METDIVKVRYLDEKGEPQGREYTYFTAEPITVGEEVRVPVQNGTVKAQVTATNVPDSEIAAFRDKVKNIPGGSILIDMTLVWKAEGQAIADKIGAYYVGPQLDESGGLAYHLFNVEGTGKTFTGKDMESALKNLGECVNRFNGETKDPESGSLAAAAIAAGAEVTEVNMGVTLLNPPIEITFDGDDTIPEEPDLRPTAMITVEPESDPSVIALYNEGARLKEFADWRVIKSVEDMRDATNDLTLIAGVKQKMEAKRVDYVAPIRKHLDAFNTAFKNFMAPLNEADTINRGKVKDYRDAQAKQARDAEQLNRDKMELARREAALNGTGEVTIDTTPVIVPEVFKSTHTGMGSTGTMKVWKFEVVDFALLPDEYKLPDTATINAVIKKNHDAKQIPGLRIYCDEVVTVRARQGE